MSVKFAVIGAGAMGALHARILAQELPGATLQLVCDTDLSRARSVAEEFGAQDAVSDPNSAIERTDVDAVIIASPDFTHAPLSISCIEAGKRALCEKPLSQNSDECVSVLEMEQSANARHIMVGFMRRFDRAYMEMKTKLDQGCLGRALVMHNFHRNVKTPNSDFTNSMAITNSAPHEFDVARYVLGAEYTSIIAYQSRRSDNAVAPVVMILETTDEQLVTIEINNNASYGYDVFAELVGETGSVTMNNVAYTRTNLKLTSSTRFDVDWCDRYHEAYVRQNRAFLQFVETGIFPEAASDCWDGYCASIVAEIGVKVLGTGLKQPVKMIPKPEFYATPKGIKK